MEEFEKLSNDELAKNAAFIYETVKENPPCS